MTLKSFRRVVTGHDEAGRAIIQSDAPVQASTVPPRAPRCHDRSKRIAFILIDGRFTDGLG
jgi:hypothetical protein